jgi:hypothetical protein
MTREAHEIAERVAAALDEHEQRVEHVVVVEAMEERQLLVAVRLIVGGVDVERDQLGRRDTAAPLTAQAAIPFS